MAICLVALPPVLRAQSIQGLAVTRGTNNPINSGVIILFDDQGSEAARATLARGRFSVTAPAAGRYRLRLDAIGFRTTITPFFDLVAGGTLAVTLEVRQQGPITLDTVDVAGEAVPARMLDFYQRRAAGFGEFMIRDEWERFYPTRITDVMRRMQGFSVTPNPQFSVGGDFREYLILNYRLGELARMCPPLVFLDGTFASNAATFDFDGLLAVDHLEGIEMYNGPGSMPPEFNRQGANCGVISVWTAASTGRSGPALSNHLDFGAQVGARVTGGGAEEGRVGVQAVIALGRIIELYPMANVLFGGPGDSRTLIGWQVFGAVRVRPFGARTPWYLGTGLTAIEINDPLGFQESVERQYHVLLTGMTLAVGNLRPFLEVQVLGPLTRNGSEVHLFTGLGFRVY
jgi:hypothetical protein